MKRSGLGHREGNFLEQNTLESIFLSAYLYLTDSFHIRGQGYYLQPSWEAGSVVLTEAHRLADVICFCHQMITFVFLNNTK